MSINVKEILANGLLELVEHHTLDSITVKKLLEDLDPNLEVAKEEVNCTGDCAACAGCEDQYHRYFSRKQEKSVPDLEPELESEPIKVSDEYILTDEDIQMALSSVSYSDDENDDHFEVKMCHPDWNRIRKERWYEE